MEKIILYYKFCPLDNLPAIRLWQTELCRRLNLKGRIIIAPHGINGTLAGLVADLKAYKKALNEFESFRHIEYKWSAGCRDDFPKLSVKVRSELVSLKPTQKTDVFKAPVGLSPQKWHQYLKQHPQTLVLDARNDYESELGYFKVPNLIKPKIKTFRQIKKVVAGLPKDKPILTYCTGDVRCEYLSAYMQDKGFAQVHHLQGGILKYGQVYKDDGFWQGKCYVFDRRMQIGFSSKAVDLAKCSRCHRVTSSQVNCDDCNRQLVVCVNCQKFYRHCKNLTVSSRQR